MHKNATRFHEYVEKHETRKNGERRGKKDELPLSARLPESNGDFLYNGTSPHDYCRAAYFQTYFSAARLRMETPSVFVENDRAEINRVGRLSRG